MLNGLIRTGAAASLCLLAAAAPAQAKHGMTVDDLAKVMHVGSPVISPDGTEIAYTVSRVATVTSAEPAEAEDDKSITELWMVDWEGKNDVQLTYGPEGAGDPRWSPDGKYLAFTSSRPGKAKGDQVWVLDRRGGEARQLTDVKQSLNGYRWSPDGKTLLLTLREKEEPEPEKGAKDAPPKPIVLDRYQFKQDVEGYVTDKRDHLFLFDIATKKLDRLTASVPGKDYAEGDAEWSPDGKTIAFVSNQSAPDPDRNVNSDVFVVDAKAGSMPRKLTVFTGSDLGPLAWSPDGAKIAYRQGSGENYSIYEMQYLALVDVASAKVELIGKAMDKWVGPPVFAADGRTLLASVGEDRVEYIASIAPDGPAKRLTPAPGEANQIDQKSGHVAFLYTTDAAEPEIYALDGTNLRKLTSHNDALMAELNLAPAEDLSAKTKDGNEVHSLLTMPVGYTAGTKVPMVLWIHGGPTGQDNHSFVANRQIFAAHGYAVLNVNYRGSTGRGHAYSEAINNDWGNKEVIDLLASVDAAIATGRIDPDKLAIGGWSYGGILTDYTIASTNRFKAASSGAGMGNLLGLYGVDEYILQYEFEIGPPWKDPQHYIKLSYPLFHADRIKTPTLFMGGDKDFNVPLQGGEQMYQALKSVGTPAELIVYPGQFHGLTRPSFIKDRFVRWMAWYDKYLGIAPVAVSTTAKPDAK